MKKKIFGVILAAALVVSQAATVFAAGSRTSDVVVSGDSESYYEVYEGTEETFTDISSTVPETVSTILEINSGSSTLQSLAQTIRDIISAGTETVNMTEEQVSALETEIEGKTMVTQFFDLIPINGGVQNENGQYVATLSVPSLTTAMTNVRILHFSTERALWEVITPDDVNYDSKEITATFEDLSPVAIIADVDETAADNAVGTSPQTGVTSTWMLWLGAAVVLAVAAAVTFRKVRR